MERPRDRRAQHRRHACPHQKISVFFRSDESGTTENFTKYLAGAAPSDLARPTPSKTWSGKPAQGAAKSSGVAQGVKSTDGAIGYIEWSNAKDNKLGVAQVDNGGGPGRADRASRRARRSTRPRSTGTGNDLRLKLDYATKTAGAYPIVLVTYEIVCSKGLDADKTALLKAFLTLLRQPRRPRGASRTSATPRCPTGADQGRTPPSTRSPDRRPCQGPGAARRRAGAPSIATTGATARDVPMSGDHRPRPDSTAEPLAATAPAAPGRLRRPASSPGSPSAPGVFVVSLVAAGRRLPARPGVAGPARRTRRTSSPRGCGTSGDQPPSASPTCSGSTVLSSVVAMVIAVPVAVGVALFLTQYAPPRLARPVRGGSSTCSPPCPRSSTASGACVRRPVPHARPELAGDALGWIPLFSGDDVDPGSSIFAGGVVLAIMILPIVTAISARSSPRPPRPQGGGAGPRRDPLGGDPDRGAAVRPPRRDLGLDARPRPRARRDDRRASSSSTPSVAHFTWSIFTGGETFARKIANNAARVRHPVEDRRLHRRRPGAVRPHLRGQRGRPGRHRAQEGLHASEPPSPRPSPGRARRRRPPAPPPS